MADLLGYSVDELLSMKATDLNPRQSQRGWRTLFERVGEIGVATNEFLFIRKDGSPIAVEVIDNYLKFGDAEYIFSSVRDISERKSTEDALRMTQFAVDTAHDGIFWVDRDGRFAYANEAAADMLGYSREQLLKLRIPDTSPWRTIAAWRTQFDELRRIGVRTDEFPLRRRDGSSVAVEITDNHFKFGEHEFVFSYVRDITERKRTESALRLTQFAVHNASDGIFWTGRDGTFAYANEAAARLLGYGSGAELTGLNVTDINPDQTPQSWLSLFEEIKRGNALTSEQYFVTKDGRRIPVEVTDNYFVYEDREHVFAYFRDITERKQTEDSLKLTQFSVDNAAGAVFWADADGSLIYANAAACELLEYSLDDYQNLSVSDLDPDMTLQRWRERFVEVRQNPRASTTEVKLRTKSGKLIPAEITDNYIKFDEREYIFAFAVDISARKAAEAELREREQQLASVTHNIPGSVFQRRVSADGKIDFPYVSAGSKLVWGIEPDAVEKNPEAFLDILHPEDRKELESKARESAKI